MPTVKRTLPVKGLTLNTSAGFTKSKIKVGLYFLSRYLKTKSF